MTETVLAALRRLFSDARYAKFFPAGEDSLPVFAALGARLIETNEKFNLTAITDPDGVAARHILDSLLAADHLKSLAGEGAAPRLLDVGSGAGFPALPIAIAYPAARVIALDSTAKKCAYMNECAAALGLPNFSAISARAEEAGHEAPFRASFDFVTARAVANLPILCEFCLPFVKVGGAFVALKGENAKNELAAAERAMAKLGACFENLREYYIPGDEKPRYLLTLRKVSPTDDLYPRQYAQMRKKTL